MEKCHLFAYVHISSFVIFSYVKYSYLIDSKIQDILLLLTKEIRKNYFGNYKVTFFHLVLQNLWEGMLFALFLY